MFFKHTSRLIYKLKLQRGWMDKQTDGERPYDLSLRDPKILGVVKPCKTFYLVPNTFYLRLEEFRKRIKKKMLMKTLYWNSEQGRMGFINKKGSLLGRA